MFLDCNPQKPSPPAVPARVFGNQGWKPLVSNKHGPRDVPQRYNRKSLLKLTVNIWVDSLLEQSCLPWNVLLVPSKLASSALTHVCSSGVQTEIFVIIFYLTFLTGALSSWNLSGTKLALYHWAMISPLPFFSFWPFKIFQQPSWLC